MFKAINNIKPTKANWIKCLGARPTARLRLVCFPYAGGGINVFKRWPQFFSQNVEVYAVHLPGRESRFNESFVDTMREAIDSIAMELAQYRKQPIAFFGHSMGSLLAYEVARVLNDEYDWSLEALIISGRRPPHIYTGGDLHKKPDAEFIAEICRYNGTPPEVFADSELRELFLPILRSDYTILENYRHIPGAMLNCPMAACAGKKDAEFAPVKELQAWRELTAGPFTFRLFEGDHFYLNNSLEQLAKFIKECINDKAPVSVVK